MKPGMKPGRRGPRRWSADLACILVLLSLSAAAEAEPFGYPDHAALVARIQAIAGAHGEIVSTPIIGKSRDGRAIHAIEIAAAGGVDPEDRSAMLVVANIDGDHLAGSAVALGVVDALLERHANGDEAIRAFLTDHVLYVIPRVNPDAAEAAFGDVRDGRRRNLRPDDADRDGEIDEDPPNDLDGDGLVTMMRVFDASKADRRADPDDARLDLEAESAKGERAEFYVIIEGVDDDGDGDIDEDAVGGVDLNRNFMQGYLEHDDGTGPHQVSEPESFALLRYVLEHQNIAVVLTYGRHDNLVKTPDGKGRDPAGTPKSIEEKDVALYAHIGERFRELTGLERAEERATDGAFFAWAYAQFGVPSFATTLWARPDVPEPEPDAPEAGGSDEADGDAMLSNRPATRPDTAGDDAPDSDDGGDETLTPSGVGDISLETLDELRAAAEASGFEVTDEMAAEITVEQVEQFAQMFDVEIRRVTRADGDGEGAKGEDAQWLRYSDAVHDGAGFIAWTPFEHPDLGHVEIGGWAPYFRVNPPPADLADIVAGQVAFVVDLAGRLPRLRLETPVVTALAQGLYQVETALVNDGYFPTGTAMAVRNRRARPHVVRLDVDLDKVVSGRRVTKIWSIAGSGGREDLRWLIEAKPGSTMTITVYSEKYGSFDTDVVLEGEQGDDS